jgi:uncharacterized phage-associated protein
MPYIKTPPYDARAVANYFLELAKRDGKALDPMKIQKLVYLAHGWSLAVNRQPLIVDKVEAWRYGPVIRSLYSAFRDEGSGPIGHPAYDARIADGKLTFIAPRLDDIGDPFNKGVKDLLDEVWRVYGDLSAVQLSNFTHQQGSPWEQTWKPDSTGLVISDDLIKDYFLSLATEHAPA